MKSWEVELEFIGNIVNISKIVGGRMNMIKNTKLNPPIRAINWVDCDFKMSADLSSVEVDSDRRNSLISNSRTLGR